jgi:hypothetical protein
MRRVVLPPTTCTTSTTHTTWTTSTPSTAHTTYTANSTCATNTTYAASTTWTACTANTSYAADAANTSYTSYTADTANTSDTANTTPPTAAANVRVAIEVIVDVDVDIATTPAAAPAPPATPHCAHRDTNAERYRHPRRIVSRRRVVNRRIGVHRWPIHDRRIVRRHVHHLGIRLFDDDRALAFNDLCLYFLLLTRLQIAGFLSLLAHTLNCFHYIGLLRQKRIAEIRRPLDIVSQALDQVGQSGQRLDAWVPGLLGHSISESFIFQPRILRKPLLELNNLKRIRGGGKGLGQHRIRK